MRSELVPDRVQARAGGLDDRRRTAGDGGDQQLRPAANGYPALIVRVDGEVTTVMAVRAADGRIAGLYAVRNPEKLSHVERETTLRR